MATLARFIAEQRQVTRTGPERAATVGQVRSDDPDGAGISRIAGHHGPLLRAPRWRSPEVAQALEEQYLPRFAGDRLPATATGQNLALADRLDTLLGIFAIGQAPSGAKDPFALRRAALGVLRILIEGELDLNLLTLLEHAASQFEPTVRAGSAVEAVLTSSWNGCVVTIWISRYVRILSRRCWNVGRIGRWISTGARAVGAFRNRPEAASLAAANKRIRNILRKVDTVLPFEVRPDLLTEAAEQALAGRLVELSSEAIPLMEAGLYGDALNRLASLREPVDAFFRSSAGDGRRSAVRDNRIALLNELGSLFLRVADFSRLQD